MYDWRKQKERLLGLDENSYKARMRLLMAAKEAELAAIERENAFLGYCDLCGYPNTTQGDCANPACELSHPVKVKHTREEWLALGIVFQLNKVLRVVNDYNGCDTGC